MKVLADQQIPFARQAFAQFGNVELIHGRAINNEILQDVDILLVRSITPVNESLLNNTPVKFVGTATSGFDHIDQEYLHKNAIAYTHAPGSNSRSVAEYILSALLVVFESELEQIQNSVVSIIGYGHVGSKVARFLQALGVECLINDPPVAEMQNSDSYVSLDEALTADIITLHVPLTFDGKYPTYHLIGKKQLNSLKHNAVVINTSRGGVVDETALLDIIQSKSLTAVVDVWENEPLINRRLVSAAKIATAHIAGYSTDGKLRATDILYQNACQYFQREAVWRATDAMNFTSSKIDLSTENASLIEMVKSLVMDRYDIRQDHKLLARIIELSDAEKAEYFDNLRKNYRTRYEFKHTQYKLSDKQFRYNDVFETLGFSMERTE